MKMDLDFKEKKIKKETQKTAVFLGDLIYLWNGTRVQQNVCWIN